MGLLWRVAAAGGLLGLAAGRLAEQLAVGDEVVLLQQLPKRPLADYVVEPGYEKRFLSVYNSTKDRSLAEALGGLVEAWYGPDQGGKRIKGLEPLTEKEYHALMEHPWVQQAMQGLKLGSPERVYAAALSLHSLLRKTGDKWGDMVKDIKVDEQRDRAEWQARFANPAPPGAGDAAQARRGPSFQDLFKGADEIVAASKRPKFGAFQPLPLSRMVQPGAPRAAAAAAGPPPPMGAPPQAAWGGFGPAGAQPGAPPQWQQWQQPQPMGPPAWGGAYPQQAYQGAQPMPYAQYGAPPVQPMPGSMPQQGPQPFAFGQPMQGMQGYAPPMGPTQQ